MKLTLKTILAVLLILTPVKAKSQNWMMAQQYATAALDSMLNSIDENATGFIGCEYSHFRYDPDDQNYSLMLTDYLEDTSFVSVITVNLHGGKALFLNDTFDSFLVEVPDWSDCVFLWNATGKKISFSMSCNDSEYSTYTLEEGKFDRYLCSSAEAMYIKISTMVNGAETGQIHYKILKGKGYKVQWDSTAAKFEVYADDRLID